MYGYFLMALIGVILFGLAIGQLTRARPRRREHSALERTTPSADAPTPGRSETASKKQKEAVDLHTPPE